MVSCLRNFFSPGSARSVAASLGMVGALTQDLAVVSSTMPVISQRGYDMRVERLRLGLM
jgi:hypothetical protein